MLFVVSEVHVALEEESLLLFAESAVNGLDDCEDVFVFDCDEMSLPESSSSSDISKRCLVCFAMIESDKSSFIMY